jgi:sec-independent protein translocase protein TatA
MLTSLPDLLIIGGAALLIFGPKRLPELAKSLGKGIREFKKAVDGPEETAHQPEQQVLPPEHAPTPSAAPGTQAATPVKNDTQS